jgi:anti-sigma factor RsiW
LNDSLLHPSSERLEALVEGTLDEAEQVVLNSHVVGCPRCQSELEEWRSLFVALASLPQMEPSVQFADHIMAAINLPLPLPARVASIFRRFVPKSKTTWTLATIFLALPIIVTGAFAAWVIAQPWLTLEGLLVFGYTRASAATIALASYLGRELITSAPAVLVSNGVQKLMAIAGVGQLGIIIAAFATLTLLSVWVLYRFLFRTTTRETTNYALHSF